MKICPNHVQRNLSYSIRPCLLLLIAATGGVYGKGHINGNGPKVSLSPDGKTLQMSHTKDVLETSVLVADTTRIWKTPHGDTKYFKIKKMDEAFIRDEIVPISVISESEMLSRSGYTGIISPPAIADKVMKEASLTAYDSFTGVTRSLLKGRIPANAIVGGRSDLFKNTPKSQWLASRENEGLNYSDQNEGSSYGERVANGARAMTQGPWFTVLQVYGHYFDQDPMNNLAGFKSSGYGLHGALLLPVGDQWLMGVYGGWQKLNADLRHTSGDVEAGSWKLGPTIAWSAGSFHAEGLLTYSWNQIKNKVNHYSGEYKSNQWDTYLKGGVDIDMGGFIGGLSLTPDVQVLYSSQNRDSFDWAFNNKIKSDNTKGWTTRVGGTFGYDRLQFEQPLELTLAAGWQYNQFKTGSLEAGNGEIVEYEHYDRHGMYYSASADTRINEVMNLSLSYAGLWSGNAFGHYMQAGIEFRF